MKIFSQAPTRVSLFGGSTDLPEYAERFGGLVLSMAINIRQKITMYSDDELFEIRKHQFPYRAKPEFYYQILEEFGINDGMHLTKLICEFDGLIESGLGSSASAAVALIGAINKRLKLNMTTDQIINKAWDLEVNKIGLYGGKQDQIAAAYGGVNVIEFDSKFKVMPLTKDFIQKLISSIVLFHIGENRETTTIQEGLKNLTSSQIDKLDKIKDITTHAILAIDQGDIPKIGYFMDQSWLLKRQSNKEVTNPYIDALYRRGLENGAYGGKILGSGGGGYMIFIVDPKNKEKFIEKMGLDHWDFDISMDGLDVRDITNK